MITMIGMIRIGWSLEWVVVRMDFWMVKKDIRMARKVTMVVTVSKNLDFAEK